MLILLDGENLNENMCPYHVILGFFLTLVLQLFTLHSRSCCKLPNPYLGSAMYEEFVKTCLFLVIWLIAVKAYALLDIVRKWIISRLF
jgi:hypothetical protein